MRDNLDKGFSDEDTAEVAVVKDSTLLTFTYSWIVRNPWISWLEKKIIRQSMLDDNVIAINKLGSLCELNTFI